EGAIGLAAVPPDGHPAAGRSVRQDEAAVEGAAEGSTEAIGRRGRSVPRGGDPGRRETADVRQGGAALDGIPHRARVAPSGADRPRRQAVGDEAAGVGHAERDVAAVVLWKAPVTATLTPCRN